LRQRGFLVLVSGACPGGGSEGSGPTRALAHGRFYTYVLNNIDVVITIIYSQMMYEYTYSKLEKVALDGSVECCDLEL